MCVSLCVYVYVYERVRKREREILECWNYQILGSATTSVWFVGSEG